MSDSYLWDKVVVGSWSAAANWIDETTSSNPAITPPGADDNVTIEQVNVGATELVTGTGTANSLSFLGGGGGEPAYLSLKAISHLTL